MQDCKRSIKAAMRPILVGVKAQHDAQADRLNQSIQAKALHNGAGCILSAAYQPGNRGGQG